MVARDVETYKINDETVQEGLGEILLYNNTQDINLTEVGGEVIVGDNPKICK
jgi:hypothetical protein